MDAAVNALGGQLVRKVSRSIGSAVDLISQGCDRPPSADNAGGIVQIPLGEPEDQAPETTTYQGRSYTHWSQYLLVCGAVVGLVIAVAAYVFMQFNIVALGAGFFVTNATGAFYLRKFVVLFHYDEYMTQLNNQATNQARLLQETQSINANLTAQNTAMTVATDNLKQQLQKTKELSQQAAVDYKRQLEDRDRTIQDLAASIGQLQVFQNLYEELKKTTDTVTDGIVEFSQGQGMVRDGVKGLDQKVHSRSNSNAGLNTRLQSLEKMGGNISTQHVGLAEAVKSMKMQMQILKEGYEASNEERAKLEVELSGLRELYESLQQNARDVRNVTEDVNDTDMRIKEQSKDLTVLQKLQNLFSKTQPPGLASPGVDSDIQ